mmetsp:Transcript_28577/g.52190  ORF Transcript_28577/g.52190 Transcript_28577/m.52190 type:complete len:208 (+) Transcript_28577:385-1008(+)
MLSGTFKNRKQSAHTPASARASACAGVRGKPSRSHPFFLQSPSLKRSLTTPMITSSGTSFPLSMNSLAFFPTSVWATTAARSMSPVLRCTTPYLSLIISHCVPFPDAGAPAIMIFSGSLAALPADELLWAAFFLFMGLVFGFPTFASAFIAAVCSGVAGNHSPLASSITTSKFLTRSFNWRLFLRAFFFIFCSPKRRTSGTLSKSSS